jgi:cytochrome d ubiquinol oxidase subunit I
MENALAADRLHFAFTVTFHYIFPQLTMGLALLILILKTVALRLGTISGAALLDSGRVFLVSVSLSELLLVFRWNFNLARTGPNSQNRRAA